MSRFGRSSRLPGAVILALALAGGGPAAAQAPAAWLTSDGHAWRALNEGEKMALLTGFLVGGALERGVSAAGAGAPSASPSPERLEAMRREGRLRFPYAPSVYKARLEDFYFYQDRLGVPLYEALFLINEQLRRGSPRPY